MMQVSAKSQILTFGSYTTSWPPPFLTLYLHYQTLARVYYDGRLNDYHSNNPCSPRLPQQWELEPT